MRTDRYLIMIIDRIDSIPVIESTNSLTMWKNNISTLNDLTPDACTGVSLPGNEAYNVMTLYIVAGVYSACWTHASSFYQYHWCMTKT